MVIGMRRTFIRILAVGALTALTACGASAGTSGPGSSTGPIVIGYEDALSGSFASFTLETQRGFNLAISEVNQAGGVNGRKINVITLDSGGVPATGVTNTLKLITDDNVMAVFGYSSSAEASAALKLTTKYDVPAFTFGQNGTLLSSQNIFRVGGNITTLDSELVKQVVAAGYTKIATVTGNDLNGQESQTTASQLIQQYAKVSPVTKITFVDGSQDYTPVSLSLRSAKPQAVYIDGSGTDPLSVLKNAENFGLTSNTLWFGPPLSIPTTPKVGGAKLVAGTVFATFVNYNKPATTQLQAKISKNWSGDVVDYAYVQGYDAGKVLAAALAKPGAAASRSGLLNALQTLKDVSSVGGPPGYTINFSKGTGEAHEAYQPSSITLDEWLPNGKPGPATIKPPGQ